MNPLWMILASLAAVGGLAAVFAAQHAMKRRRALLRPLAPLCTTEDHTNTPPLEVLMRESLVKPNRALNVHAWDNTPPSVEDVDLNAVADFETDPLLIDRDFLVNRGRHGGGNS